MLCCFALNISNLGAEIKKTIIIMLRTISLLLLVIVMNIKATATQQQAYDSFLKEITGAAKPEKTYDITKYGARGDGKKDCKPAFDKIMKTARKKGGAHIVVPAGVYLLKGPLHLADNVCLELQEGSVLRFSPEPHLYLPAVKTSWEGTYLYNYSPFIYGCGLKNVSIVGKGVIDGNCAETFATWKSLQKPGQMRSRDMNHQGAPVEDRRFGEGDYLRPQLIQLYNCKGITIEDVFITNSPFWCIHLLNSENIVCRGIRFDAKLVNNDGIDLECSRNVLIEDVHFNNGDDNVAIKSGRDNDGWTLGQPSENIIVRNCHFKGLHAVVIGSEMSAGVQNVFVENCDYAGYCKRGLYIKTNPDRGGFVKNIYVNNCVFDEVEDLLYVTSMYAGEGLDNNHFTEIDNLYVNGIRCRKVRQSALVLQGTPQKPIRNVRLQNIEVGECKNAMSFENTEPVMISNCFIGGKVGVPTQAAAKDKLFEKDK